MLKKSAILLPYSNTSSSYPHISMTPPSHASCHNLTRRHERRHYATVNDRSDQDHNIQDRNWPKLASANATPTPYQIFNQKKGSKYSKERFYELVKIYHPDRHDTSTQNSISYETKLERYRLVVAANEILADPIKRSAYDCYGAGWGGMPGVRSPRENHDSPNSWGNSEPRGWSGGPNGPSRNATWEDWERWYSRDSHGPQQPRFVSNSAFVALIVIFAALGGVGQATRVGNYSSTFIEQRDALHENISKDLMRRRRETANISSNKEERIHNFLRQRDMYGYGAIEYKIHTTYERLLAPPELCSGDNPEIKRRQTPRSSSKPP